MSKAVASASSAAFAAAGRRAHRLRIHQLATDVISTTPARSSSFTVATLPSSNLLQKNQTNAENMIKRSFGSDAHDQDYEKIGKFFSGLTKDRIVSEPDVKAYVDANYPNDDKANAADGLGVPNHGINVPDAILKEFGVTDEEMEGMMSSTRKKQSKKERLVGDDGRPVDLGLGSEEQQRLNIRVLKSFVRTVEGSRMSEALREDQKMIPGVLYGGDPFQQIFSHDLTSRTLLQTPWSELQRELDRYHRYFESRVYDLTIFDDDDTPTSTHRVVPRNVQRHPVMGKIYCANFVRYHPERPLKIPLKYVNIEESPALKRDGYIIPVSKYVECFVEDGVSIPDFLEVECTGLVLKDVIRMDRVIFPNGVRYTDRTDVESFVVGPVRGGRSAAMAGDDDGGEDGSGNAAKAAA
jgi:ribosomal protein L25 (general stress protein Ctc)